MTITWFILLFVFILFGGFRGIIAWALLFMVFSMVGCATVDPDQAEYDRVEWVETQFKPAVANCKASGGVLVYDGPYSQRIRRILDTEDWSRVHRTEFLSFRCAKRG
jgi:hypothetical protein